MILKSKYIIRDSVREDNAWKMRHFFASLERLNIVMFEEVDLFSSSRKDTKDLMHHRNHNKSIKAEAEEGTFSVVAMEVLNVLGYTLTGSGSCDKLRRLKS